jgi:acetoin utilization deacetylase AcuC-like enzyme
MGDKNALHVCFCWRDIEEDNGTKICVNVSDVGGDEEYLEKVKSTFPLIESFSPDMLVHFFGHDTHWDDYGSLGLSEDFYIELAVEVKSLADRVCNGKYVILDGGGANNQVGKYIWPKVIQVLKE